MVVLAEGLAVAHQDAVDRLLQVLERLTNLRAIGGPGLLDRSGQQVDRVVSRRCPTEARDALDLVGFLVVLDEGRALGRGPRHEGLREQRALCIGACRLDEVRHRQRVAADHRNLPVELGHAVGDLRQFRPHRVSEDDFGARVLGAQQLRGHVDVLDVELLDHHRLDAALVQSSGHVLAPELAVVRRVGQDRDLLVPALVHRLVGDHVGLDVVGQRDAEDVVLGVLRRLEQLGDLRPRGARRDDGDLGFLVEARTRQDDAGIDDADAGDDVLLVDQLLRHLRTALVLCLVVALDELQGPAKHAAGAVDLLDREADRIAHRNAHRARPAGERARQAHLDGICGVCAEGAGNCHGHCKADHGDAKR